MKFFKYLIQAIILYFFFLVGKVLGLKISRTLFSNIFIILAPLFKSKKIINKNLSIFNSDISKKEKDKIILSMWKNYGMTFIEYVFLSYFQKNNSHIKILGENNLQKIIEKNKPVIFVSGHFANYELMSMEIVKKKIKLATIYRPLNNFFVNPLMEFLRRRFVCKNQIKKGINGVRDAINYIKQDYSIALMIDQRVSEGEKINFFGKPAFTTTLPAQLALKFGLSVVPVFLERDEFNNFTIQFYEEIKSSDFKNKLEMTKKLNNFLESLIIKNPYQWIWTHNRWK
tara:strand:- start:4791 stop:5645 length:855 start_codon:yes stop_codon:yes gene_type:complete